jgi:UDP-N-acetylmuramoyl-tripeptide--D-alanyl-D-alanine ligase
MAATLAVPRGEPGRRIAVLGTMRELGSHSDQAHRDLAEPIAAAQVRCAILVGEEMAPLARALPPGVEREHVPDAKAAVAAPARAGRGRAMRICQRFERRGLSAVVEEAGGSPYRCSC